MFGDVKRRVKDKFDSIASSQSHLFHVEVDRDKIYEIYLDGFVDPVERQGHDCNCCKSFLRQFSGLVAISNNQRQSIWDISLDGIDEIYHPSIKAIAEYIHSLPITNVFVHDNKHLGTDKTPDAKNNVVWEHFYVQLPNNFVHRSSSSIESVQGTLRDSKNVLKRSLDELTLDACDVILELTAQNTLYKGREFKANVEQFAALKREYDALPEDKKDNFCWVKSTKVSASVSKIRNSAIGTLLVDLSNGEDLDRSVSAYERVVAPSNYKRPTALITPKMVEAMQTEIQELGCMDSLDRRYATAEDISIENVLFVDRSSEMSNVFDDLKKDVLVNPKTFNKVESVSIEDFIKNILPTTKSVELLVENTHLSNLMSILTGVHKSAPSLFKWDNAFSWSYTGGITDSMKERVKAAGGKVDGELRFSIQWNENGNNNVDFDAHAIEPMGHEIYYGGSSRAPGRSNMSGQLDVDIISPGGKIAVENITWSDRSKMGEGVYTFFVENFSSTISRGGFAAQVEFDGNIFDFAYNKNLRGKQRVEVAKVKYSRAKGFEIVSSLDGTSAVVSKEKWNINTNQFVKVKSMMLSPNYWNGQVGNKHYLFNLEGCVSDEAPRPFFNEFLNDKFSTHRKAFEVLGSKVKVTHQERQLSGLGFSETQRNYVYARVEGSFKRVVKINF